MEEGAGILSLVVDAGTAPSASSVSTTTDKTGTPSHQSQFHLNRSSKQVEREGGILQQAKAAKEELKREAER